ncbi:DMT family transporter [Niveispirillum sp. KHB5.9]|uniref:DMT family transporter n=1 Tax=Niveispirillum sp. KHB5.9 TaxID=3400269 RepID=UPI003A8C7924
MGGRALAGIGFFIAATLLFGIMDALIKHLTADYGTWQIMFFRASFSLLPIGILIARTGGAASLRTKSVTAHAARSLMGVAAAYGFFYGFSVMPLADVYALGFAAPLFMTALSVPILKEKVGWRRWLAVLVGFGGVMVMLRPGQGMFSLLALIPLGAAFFYALSMLFVRSLARTESNGAITFYFVTTMGLVSFVCMIPGWRTPDMTGFLLLALVGVVGGVAQIIFTQAFRLAAPSLLAPFEYVAMIWAAGFGYIFFAEVPDAAIWTGCAIVAASGLYIIHRETVLHRQAALASAADGEPIR